jgi:enterochelin esterase-like enzyme
VRWRFACGKGDGLVTTNRDFAAALTAKNVRHTYVETEGNHSWPIWRRYLADFVPLIFRD